MQIYANNIYIPKIARQLGRNNLSSHGINSFPPEMSIAALPLPPPLPTCDRRGVGGAVAVFF
jgi:hypothetical protein